jgi:glycosyltransferase involved in cell wall biosynthesis
MTLSHLVDGLRARHWRVAVVRPRQRGEDASLVADPQQVLVPGLPIPGYAGLRFGLPVVRMLQLQWQASRPSIVHVATEGPLGWAAMKAAHSLDIPVTTTFHTNFHRYCTHYRLGWLRGAVTRHLRLFHNQGRCTMVPNSVLRQTLQQEGYRNVVELGRGVDTRLFNPARRNMQLRAQWGVGERDPVVLYVGRLAPEKNLSTALAAFEQIERHNARVRMVWVGDGPELSKLKRQHPRHVFAGVRTGVELAEHYASADMFLFPSLTETFGNVVTEAMASGLAVVAFDYAAAAQYIKQRQSGLLVPFGDNHGFIHKAQALVAQPQLMRLLGKSASTALAMQSWEVVCGQFEQHLRTALQGARDA